MSQARIAEETGYGIKTVTRAIRLLVTQKLILEDKTARKGRRTKAYRFPFGSSSIAKTRYSAGRAGPKPEPHAKVEYGRSDSKACKRGGEGRAIGDILKASPALLNAKT